MSQVSQNTANQKLAQALLQKGYLSTEQLEFAIKDCKRSGITHLGQYLIKNKWLDTNILVQEMQYIERIQNSHVIQNEITNFEDTTRNRTNNTRKAQVALVGPGQKFSNYVIIREIARGGMGVVYLAQDAAKRHIALKVLLSSSERQEEVTRFAREGKAISSLAHPNIIRLYNMGVENGYRFFTMDYIDGGTFENIINDESNFAPLVRILIKISKALHFAHQKKIIHRDMKPSNILMDKNQEPYITDFGLAKMSGDKSMTRSGSTLGTPQYMSPEQALGEVRKIDHRSDIYSLGAILYKCITKKLPFEAETLMSLYKKISIDNPIPPRQINNKIPVLLEEICLKALEKKQSNRYQSALEFARDLEKCLSNRRRGRSIVSKREKSYKLWRKYQHYFVAIIVVMFAFIAYKGFSQKKPENEPHEYNDLQKITVKTAPSLKSSLQEARIAIQEKDYEKVQQFIETTDQKAEIPPEYKAEYNEFKVHFALEKKDYPLAYNYSYSLLTELDNAKTFLYRGKAAFFLEKYEESINNLNKSLQYKSRNEIEADTYLYLAMVHRTIGEYQKALTMLDKTYSLDSSNYLTTVYLGAVTLELKDYEKAYKYLHIAKEKIPGEPLIYESLGKYYLQKKQIAKAIENFDICLKMVPWEARYFYLYGLALVKNNQNAQAEEYFIRALELEPGNLEAFLPLMISLMDQGTIEKMTLVPGYYNSYSVYSSSHGEPDDLFRDHYNALNLRYRVTHTKKEKPDYQNFIGILGNPQLKEMHDIAINALSYHYDDRKLMQIINEQQSLTPKNVWDRVLAQMGKQKYKAEKDYIRRLVVRLWIGQDPKTLSILDEEKRKGEQYLQEILEFSSENMIMRFLACKTLIALGTPSGYSIVERYLNKYDNIDIAILATISLKEKKFPVNERILENGLKHKNPFLRSFCVRYVENDELIVASLQDEDERVRVYAAQRLYNSRKSQHIKESSMKILADTYKSENPFVKIYGCISLWPKKIPKENIAAPSQEFIDKYKHTLIQGLQDKHPMVKRVACARIGSYFLYDLSDKVLELVDDSDLMVRYQAYTTLAWLGTKNEVVFNLARNPEEPLLLRSTVVPVLDRQDNASLPFKIDDLIKEEEQQAARFVMSFIGIMAGQFGPFLLMPYLNHEDENVRVCAISGMIFHGNSAAIPLLEKEIKTTKSLKIKKISYATLVGIMAREQKNKLQILHKRLLKQPKEIRESASFGYYFHVYQDTLTKTLNQYVDPNKIRDYDIYRYGNVFNYLYESFYLTEYKKNIKIERLQQEYLWRLTKSLELSPHARYYYERALIYYEQQQWDKSIADLEEAVKIDTNDQKSYDLLIESYQKAEQDQKLLTLTSKLIKINPRFLKAWSARANILYKSGKINDALEAYERSFILQPKNWIHYIQMGTCHFQLQQYPEALNVFLYVSQNIYPTSKEHVLNVILCYARMKKYNEAIVFLKQKTLYVKINYEELSRYKDLYPILADPWVKSLK